MAKNELYVHILSRPCQNVLGRNEMRISLELDTEQITKTLLDLKDWYSKGKLYWKAPRQRKNGLLALGANDR